MSYHHHPDFVPLLQDAIDFLKRHQKPFFLDLPPRILTHQKLVETILPPQEEEKPLEAKEVPQDSPPNQLVETPLSPIQAQKKWSLRPLGVAEELSQPPTRFGRYFTSLPLELPVYLLLPSTALPSEYLLFENIARVITQKWAAASVQEHSRLLEIWDDSTVQLIIAPMRLLEKKIPAAQVHTFYKTTGPTILPLEEPGQYLNDLNLKRGLWTILKVFFSKNMSPLP